MCISVADYELLNAKCDDFEMNRSEYIRNIILFAPNCERTIISASTTDTIFFELNKCGKRINEIIHMINLLKRVDRRDILELIECFVDLFPLNENIFEAVKHENYNAKLCIR